MQPASRQGQEEACTCRRSANSVARAHLFTCINPHKHGCPRSGFSLGWSETWESNEANLQRNSTCPCLPISSSPQLFVSSMNCHLNGARWGPHESSFCGVSKVKACPERSRRGSASRNFLPIIGT